MVMIKSRLTVASLILLNPLLLPPSLQCLVPSMYFINESGWLDPEARQRLRREDCSQKSPEHRDAQQTIPERERERLRTCRRAGDSRKLADSREYLTNLGRRSRIERCIVTIAMLNFPPVTFLQAALPVGLSLYFHWLSPLGASFLSSATKTHVGKDSISGPLRKPTSFPYHPQILSTYYVSGTELGTLNILSHSIC